MNYKKIVFSVLIILFISIAIFSLRGVFSPYVTFKSAMDSGKYVQIIGKLNRSLTPQQFEDYFSFRLEDEDGTIIDVIYNGAKPLNFEHANRIVTLGFFNRQKKIFQAEKILIKCPSKYIKEK